MAHDVFISYSSTDQNAALAVLHGLESAGLRCWIAPRDIEPGAIWAQSIMEGITGCRVLVVVFSANANRSPHVINEVDAAVRKGVIIVPFRIEDVLPDGAMEYHLRTRHWLDALTPDLEQHTAQLAQQVTAVLEAHKVPGPTPTPPPRPMPRDLPRPGQRQQRRWQLPTSPAGWRRFRIGAAVLAVLGLATTIWLMMDHPVEKVTFTVREVSGSGNNVASVRMTSGTLRFFEAGENIPAAGQRTYTQTFLASGTRFIDVEVQLDYEAPNRNVTVPISCTLTSKGGQIITAISINAKIQPTWTSSLHVQGWGTASGGFWKPDRYQADCRYGNKLIGRNWFDVTTSATTAAANTPPAPAAVKRNFPPAEASPWREMNARVSGIRTFVMGNTIPAIGDRQTTTEFVAANTGYVGVEVTMEFDAPGRPTRAALNCRILRDRTREIGRMTLNYDLHADWRSAWSARGYGKAVPGPWEPGSYLVACDDSKRTLAQAPFEMR